jgi:hypothetical protein
MKNLPPILLFSLSILLSLGFGACKTPKPVVGGGPAKERSADFVIKKMAATRMDADWLSAKLKVNHESPDMSISFTGNIRLRRDSAIWLNVKKLGFEIARVRITPDSIWIVNRLMSEYYVEDFGYIRQMLNFPASYSTLQDLLLGNPVFFTEAFSVAMGTGHYRLWSDESKPVCNYQIDASDFTLSEMSFRESSPERSLSVEQSKYAQASKGKKFSYFRKLKANSAETGNMQVEIEFSDVEINVPKTMPFEIPSGYERGR